ncbi:MAG: DUF115 domain-containing protein [Deltaproteobacteria bacterium]|jgi:hypothetical protein|nr:DUF115 domain-containing protein [Deltaproteobacteria bacterium]
MRETGLRDGVPSALGAGTGPVRVIPGDKGPGLIYRGETVHDASDPMAEAAAWVAKALGAAHNGAGPRLALVFGLGLGWHIRRLKELFPQLTVAVYEPDRGLLDVFEKYNALSKGQDPKVYLDFARFESMVAQEVVHGEAGLPVVVAVPGYEAAFPKEAQRFRDKVGSEMARLRVIEKTRKATNSAFTDNMTRNAGMATLLPDLMLLKDRFPTHPAFVVGAGPSLSVNGHCLKDVGEKAMIIAAAAALKPLLRLGVSPHVVVVLESSDTSRFLRLTDEEKAIAGKDMVLALAMGSHPAHFACEGYRKAIFHLNPGEAQILGQGFFLPQGGNAGTAAFALAYVWGMSPLILVGQDQAYMGGLLHAEGTVDSLTDPERGDSLKVMGVGGVQVETNTSLMASVNWLSEAATLIQRRGRGQRLINASAQGARVQGFDEIPLKALTDTIPERAYPYRLQEVMDLLPKPTTKELRGDLKQMSALLTQVRQLVHRKPQRALVEMMAISNASAFMRQLLAPSLAGGHPAGILKNLAWADGVILRMLASIEAVEKPKG